MSDRLAFLRAIRASPNDDTARLAFADWLDDRDDPLGEFVRVQIELEPIRYRIDNPRAVELHRREDELLRRHGDDWIGTNELLTHPSDFGPVFRRGLPDYACLSLDTFLKNGEALFTAHPTLREVALYGIANRGSELTMSPLLAKLETLEIADWPTEDDAISLSVSPHLDKISRFKLWAGGEPYFLRELVKQANDRWPHEIELVQILGGAACFSEETARELNDATDRIVHDTNSQCPRPIVHVIRPFEQLFPLVGEVSTNVRAGHLPDGHPALACGDYDRWILAMFSEDGNIRGVTVRDNPVRVPLTQRRNSEAQLDLNTAFAEWVGEELKLQPGLVWVREFEVEDLRIELLTRHRRSNVDSSPNPPHLRDADAWRNRGSQLRWWLEQRNFCISRGGEDYWADWRGRIHSS